MKNHELNAEIERLSLDLHDARNQLQIAWAQLESSVVGGVDRRLHTGVAVPQEAPSDADIRDLLRRAKVVLSLIDKDKGSTVCAGGLIRDISTCLAAPVAAQPLLARPLAEWHEDDGPVMWWAWCGRAWAGEPAWCGTPNDSDWPGYHTHWTPHPAMPAAEGVQA